MLKKKDIDVVDIKVAIKSEKLKPKVIRGKVYLENEIGESILICNLEDFEYRPYWECLRNKTFYKGE